AGPRRRRPPPGLPPPLLVLFGARRAAGSRMASAFGSRVPACRPPPLAPGKLLRLPDRVGGQPQVREGGRPGGARADRGPGGLRGSGEEAGAHEPVPTPPPPAGGVLVLFPSARDRADRERRRVLIRCKEVGHEHDAIPRGGFPGFAPRVLRAPATTGRATGFRCGR